jgi:hypothetical protein
MKLSEELARTCVEKRAQPEVEDLRAQFEGLSQREEVLRRHAKRMHDISRRRALREDTSIPGYLATGAERLTPVPHTGLEAAIRLPLIGAAGAGGYLAGREFEPFDADDLRRILRPAGGKSDLDTAISSAVMREGQTPTDISARKLRLKQLMLREDPEVIAKALRRRKLPIGGDVVSGKLRGEIGEVADVARLRRELGSLARQTDKGILPKMKPWRLGGGILGLLAGSAATGLPLAIRALMLKRQGGEAAARAEAEAQEALESALAAQTEREELLQGLEGAA